MLAVSLSAHVHMQFRLANADWKNVPRANGRAVVAQRDLCIKTPASNAYTDNRLARGGYRHVAATIQPINRPAASVSNIPNSYTDFLQLSGLRGARIGAVTALFGSDPEDAEVATVVRGAINEMKRQGAEVVDVAIPGLTDLIADDPLSIIAQDFKFDFNAYLLSRPNAPIHSLEEVLASGKYHPTLQQPLTNSQTIGSRDTKEYLQRIVNRNILREAILKALADNRVDAVAYPTIRRKAKLIGEPQQDPNCRLSSQSGLPAITVPGGFTPDGLPVGLELLGRAWSEPQLIKVAYAYEHATHHRHRPASTPPLSR